MISSLSREITDASSALVTEFLAAIPNFENKNNVNVGAALERALHKFAESIIRQSVADAGRENMIKFT